MADKIDLTTLMMGALERISGMQEREYEGFPSDWSEQIDACSECQRYEDHPIQQGICDEHRRPIWARDRHHKDERAALGGRMRRVASDALAEIRRGNSPMADTRCAIHGYVLVQPPAAIEIDFDGTQRTVPAGEPFCAGCERGDAPGAAAIDWANETGTSCQCGAGDWVRGGMTDGGKAGATPSGPAVYFEGWVECSCGRRIDIGDSS